MTYTRKTMTPELAEKLVAQYGSQTAAAKAILADCVDVFGERASVEAVRQWINDSLRGVLKPKPKVYDEANAGAINRIAELLERSNIPVESLGNIEKVKVKSWGVHAKIKTRDDKGKVVGEEIVKDGLYSTNLVFSPAWEDGPKWPVVQPAPPTVVKFTAPTVIVPKGLRVEVVHPDTQGGFQRVLDSREFDGKRESYILQPIHDERAIDVALQITAAIQPDGFTHVGDLLDNSEFSKYLQVEEFWRVTQASIDWGHGYLARVKSAVGAPRRRNGKTIRKKLRLVDGNHDWKRLATYIQQNARAAFGLRPANSTPESWPDLSFPHLLRLDELGFEQCGMWPGSEAWLIEGRHALVVTHDPKKKGAYQASVIAGHTHQHREQTFTVRTPFGHETFTLYEIGCLCSLERAKTKGSIQRTRVPSDRGFVSEWTQGVTVVEILEDTGQHHVDFVPIDNGVAIYRGQRFASTVELDAAA